MNIGLNLLGGQKHDSKLRLMSFNVSNFWRAGNTQQAFVFPVCSFKWCHNRNNFKPHESVLQILSTMKFNGSV